MPQSRGKTISSKFEEASREAELILNEWKKTRKQIGSCDVI